MKQKVPMICNIVSLILLIVFVIKSIVDYTQYSTSLNSAPFYLWVLVNALFLVIPAIILFVIGFVVKKKLEMSRNVQSGNTQNLKSSAAPVRLPAAPASTPGTSQAAAQAGCVYRP